MREVQKRSHGRQVQVGYLAVYMVVSMLIAGCGSGDSDTSGPPSAPMITEHPQDIWVLVGAEVEFSVTAVGDEPLSYQWQRRQGFDWLDIVGADSANFTTPPVELSDDETSIRCIVSNSSGSATSDSASLRVTELPVAPVITGHPIDAVSGAGEEASFTVTATGTAPLSYQWQRSDDGGMSWTDIAAATGRVYAFDAELDDFGARFRCVVSNAAAGDATSNAAVLTVTGPLTGWWDVYEENSQNQLKLRRIVEFQQRQDQVFSSIYPTSASTDDLMALSLDGINLTNSDPFGAIDVDLTVIDNDTIEGMLDFDYGQFIATVRLERRSGPPSGTLTASDGLDIDFASSASYAEVYYFGQNMGMLRLSHNGHDQRIELRCGSPASGLQVGAPYPNSSLAGMGMTSIGELVTVTFTGLSSDRVQGTYAAADDGVTGEFDVPVLLVHQFPALGTMTLDGGDWLQLTSSTSYALMGMNGSAVNHVTLAHMDSELNLLIEVCDSTGDGLPVGSSASVGLDATIRLIWSSASDDYDGDATTGTITFTRLDDERVVGTFSLEMDNSEMLEGSFDLPVLWF